MRTINSILNFLYFKNNNNFSRKGQVTIFVIVGILLVVGIVFLFSFDRAPKITRGQDLDNPESYIDNCVREKAKTVIKDLIGVGGFPDSNDTIMYQGNAISYVCKNINYYQPCVSQYPRYVYQVQEELNLQLKEDVEQCFASLEQELTKRKYIIDAGPITLSSEIKPKITHLNVKRDFTITKGEVIKSYYELDFFINTPIYDLAMIAQEIISQEARYCYFSNDGFMILYPNFDIRKDSLGEDSIIYQIKDKTTNEQLTMAIRGCAIPPGLF